MSTSSALHAETQPRRTKPYVARKLVLAVASPWAGEVYLRSAGSDRQAFDGPEQLRDAIGHTSGWPCTWFPDRGRAGLPAAGLAPAKLIIAAQSPWEGLVYRTRPGHPRARFTSVEELMRAIEHVAGW